MGGAGSLPVAVVTGAARGIGLSIVSRLAADGFHVHAVDLREKLLAQVIGELSATGASVSWTGVDVTDEIAVAAVFKSLPRVDVLVASAAIIGHQSPIADMTVTSFREVIDVNLVGVFLCLREAIVRMGVGGRIVILSSRGALGEVNCAHYVSSKAAVIGLVRAAAMETRSAGITVNAVSPGFIRTEMTLELGEEIFSREIARDPQGRVGVPEEIADAVAFMASPRAGFITGQTLFVDGGKSLGALSSVP